MGQRGFSSLDEFFSPEHPGETGKVSGTPLGHPGSALGDSGLGVSLARKRVPGDVPWVGPMPPSPLFQQSLDSHSPFTFGLAGLIISTKCTWGFHTLYPTDAPEPCRKKPLATLDVSSQWFLKMMGKQESTQSLI